MGEDEFMRFLREAFKDYTEATADEQRVMLQEGWEIEHMTAEDIDAMTPEQRQQLLGGKDLC